MENISIKSGKTGMAMDCILNTPSGEYFRTKAKDDTNNKIAGTTLRNFFCLLLLTFFTNLV
jgi:hypothetical protein